MTWCNDSDEERGIDHELVIAPTITITPSPSTTNNNNVNNLVTHDHTKLSTEFRTITCPSCGHNIEFQDQSGINDLPGLPAGVKFDPNDQEILEHLEAKVLSDMPKLHPLIDEFIPTLQGENGICYTHPEKLPGVSKDGQIRHFFHRPSKAYTTGTRKRRKVHTDEEGSETRWHKTGKTRPVFVGGSVKGFKKILVLYTNYGRQKKPEKTNWVMHQYHLGTTEEEKDGELVVSKVFYQTQPRQCGNNNNNNSIIKQHDLYDDQDQRLMINDDNINIAPRNINAAATTTTSLMDYYNNPSFINYDHQLGGRGSVNRETSPPQLIPNLVMQGDHSSSFIRLAMDATTNKTRLDRK